jgi:hypothetical protein
MMKWNDEQDGAPKWHSRVERDSLRQAARRDRAEARGKFATRQGSAATWEEAGSRIHAVGGIEWANRQSRRGLQPRVGERSEVEGPRWLDAEHRATKGAPHHSDPPREVANLAYFGALQEGRHEAWNT